MRKTNLQLELLGDNALDFRSEGVKYAGSKSKLIKHILPEVRRLGVHKVLDGFAGTTRVSQSFARMGLSVTVNDKAVLSSVFGRCYLLAEPNNPIIEDKLYHLNNLEGVDGWFTAHYGGDASAATDEEGKRKPWQRHNTRRLDAIRPEIDRISDTDVERCVLLTSLILAMDSVDNTLGHYAAYLSKWSNRSFKSIHLQMPDIVGRLSNQDHRFFCGDVEEALDAGSYDLCYFDPPYGSNNEKMPPSRVRYGGYYHLWKTVILNDNPKLFGRANRREDSRDTADYSVFEDFRRSASGELKCLEAIQRTLCNAKSQYVVLSYSSGGRATFDGLVDVLITSGRILKTLKIDHARHVMSSMTVTGTWSRDELAPHQEFVFVIEKS